MARLVLWEEKDRIEMCSGHPPGIYNHTLHIELLRLKIAQLHGRMQMGKK